MDTSPNSTRPTPESIDELLASIPPPTLATRIGIGLAAAGLVAAAVVAMTAGLVVAAILVVVAAFVRLVARVTGRRSRTIDADLSARAPRPTSGVGFIDVRPVERKDYSSN